MLESHASVEEALSFAVPDEKSGEEIHAAIILRPGRTATEDQLKDYLKDRLSAFEVPKRFHFVEDFPRTPKGTGDRRRLAATLTAAPQESEAPASRRRKGGVATAAGAFALAVVMLGTTLPSPL